MTNSKKGSILTAAFMGVGSVWIGGHIGPGFATGTSMTTWFVRYGAIGMILPLIAMAICGGVIYFMLEYARKTKSYNYKALAHSIYGKYGTPATYLYDLTFLVTVFCAGGICVSGEATLLQNQFGIPYVVGCAVTILVSAILCMYGSKLLSMASAYMVYAVVVVVALIIAMSLIFGDGNLGEAIAQNKELAKDTSFGSALWHAVLYGCFQSSMCFNVISCCDTISTKTEAKKAVLWGYVCNVILMMLVIPMMLSYTPRYDICSEALPFLSILNRLGFSWLTWVYIILMTLAVVSSTGGLAFAASKRFDDTFKFVKNDAARKILIVVLILGVAAAASSLGLKSIMSKGNSINGYVAIAIVVLPAYTIVRSKIKKLGD